jgi:AcrR family transcriptional regulator
MNYLWSRINWLDSVTTSAGRSDRHNERVPSDAVPSGRPRDPDVARRALGAARELLAERGYAGVTFDEVAKRAGVGKSSLYLRWPTKPELVVAAVYADTGNIADIDTGSLRGDLLEVALRLLEQYWSGEGLAAFRLRADARHEPELQHAADAVRYKDSVRATRTLIRRGMRRGELPDDASPTMIGDLIVGAILVHVMATPLHLTDAVRRASAKYVESVVDTVLAGVGATLTPR